MQLDGRMGDCCKLQNSFEKYQKGPKKELQNNAVTVLGLLAGHWIRDIRPVDIRPGNLTRVGDIHWEFEDCQDCPPPHPSFALLVAATQSWARSWLAYKS